MGGADQLERLKTWITILRKTYSKSRVYPVASNIIENTSVITLKPDSGASSHYLKDCHKHALKNVAPLLDGPRVMLPNEATIQATHSGNLPFGIKLSQKGTNALVFPGLSNESLLSIGQLCDDNCVAIFTKNRVYVVKDNDLIMHGPRNRTDNLWDIQLPAYQRDSIQASPPTSCLNYIITKDKTKTDLARYLHGTAFSPRISTFSKAICNGNFVTWPGIEDLNFDRLIGTTIASELGHLD